MAKRSEIQDKYKWHVEDIIRESEWDKVYEEVKNNLPSLSAFRGKLADANEFLNFTKLDEKMSIQLERLAVFAFMKHDEDASVSKYTGMVDRSDALIAMYSQAISFVSPELTSLPDEKLNEFINNPKLADYDYFLKGIIREKPHILSEKEEKLLASMSEITGGFSDVFNIIDAVDLGLGTIDVDGKQEQLTHAKFSTFLRSEDREVRRKAFEKYYEAYKKLIHAIATTYNYNVKKDWLYARTRNYNSCLEAAISGEDVSPEVYKNLIKSVDENVSVLNEYIDYKKQALGVDKFYMYDMYVPTVKGAKLELEYEDAYKLVQEGLKVLGDDYSKLLTAAHDEGWIDVYESEGKRSGAYSISEKTTHPFVLLNHELATHDVFTIAHELGHAMHSYYSHKTQPTAKEDYVIFVAEVASTVNEVLLIKHITNTTKDKALKKFLLEYFLETLRTTLFRQTQFAEFEYEAHAMAERGEPLTYENLSEVYLNLNKKYYGKSVEEDDCIKYEWARIPHFYRNFYVYKYATGIISAVSIADGILSGDKKKLEAYKSFLCSGGSDSPVELLKIAGIDLTTKQPYERAMKVFSDTLKELKNS